MQHTQSLEDDYQGELDELGLFAETFTSMQEILNLITDVHPDFPVRASLLALLKPKTMETVMRQMKEVVTNVRVLSTPYRQLVMIVTAQMDGIQARVCMHLAAPGTRELLKEVRNRGRLHLVVVSEGSTTVRVVKITLPDRVIEELLELADGVPDIDIMHSMYDLAQSARALLHEAHLVPMPGQPLPEVIEVTSIFSHAAAAAMFAHEGVLH